MSIEREIVLSEAGLNSDMLVTEECVDSTNTMALELAAKGAPEGTAVMAEMQTRGRGRRGKSFWSADRGGIYLSIIIRGSGQPEWPNEEELPPYATVIAGICASRCIDELSGAKTKLKWVNDLIIDEKKVGGILTEGRSAGGNISCVVTGIGINLSVPEDGFPDEIRDIAGSVSPNPSDPSAPDNYFRERLAGRIIRSIREEINRFKDDPERTREPVYNEYLRRIKWMFGRELTVKDAAGNELYTAKAAGLSSDLGLEVVKDDGTVNTLRTGDVSVKLTAPRRRD